MRTVVLVLIAVLASVLIGAGIFIYSGAYSVAASEPHSRFVDWMLRAIRTHSVAAHAKTLNVPSQSALDSMLKEGFRHYRANCVECHGAPGVKPGEVAQGLNPAPPEFAQANAALDAREVFWVAKHGIRMTGMPAWGATHRDDELWAVTAFVLRLPTMSVDAYRAFETESPPEHVHRH